MGKHLNWRAAAQYVLSDYWSNINAPSSDGSLLDLMKTEFVKAAKTYFAPIYLPVYFIAVLIKPTDHTPKPGS